MSNLLNISNLQVAYSGKTALKPTTLSLKRGEKVAIVGESGSGKSTIVNAILKTLPENASMSGEIEYSGEKIGYVPQDPSTNLNPVLRVGDQVRDVLQVVSKDRLKKDSVEVIEVLERAGLKDAKTRIRQFPHQFSGGMKQRVLIGMGMAQSPELLVADEPTSALDATVATRVLDYLECEVQDNDTSLLFVTHDLSLAGKHADRIVVMKDGEIVEEGKSSQILTTPVEGYTKELLEASLGTPKNLTKGDTSEVLYLAQSLTKQFRIKGDAKGITPVNDMTFQIHRGQTLAVVGESGSGKTTLINLLMGLETPTSGVVEFKSQDLASILRSKQLRDDYIHKVSAVFQNPYASLNPTLTVQSIIEEPLKIHSGRLTLYRDAKKRLERVKEVLGQVHLDPELLGRHSSALSGGQRQRVAIARALVLEPEIIFFDEPTSALDVLVSSKIIKLLVELQEKGNLTYIFITHDMRIAHQIADSIIEMKP